jgi:hypothetical protein
LKVRHENDNCCDKKKVEKEKLKEKINHLQVTKPNSKALAKAQEEFKELNKQSLKNRITCPRFQAINKEMRECLDCEKQRAKKAIKIIPIHLQKILLINYCSKDNVKTPSAMCA